MCDAAGPFPVILLIPFLSIQRPHCNMGVEWLAKSQSQGAHLSELVVALVYFESMVITLTYSTT